MDKIFKNRTLFFILIFSISLLFRIIAGLKVDSVISGSYGFYDYATNLLAGNGYFWDYTNNPGTLVVKLVTFRPPVYTLFYTMLLWLFGNHSIPFIIIQSCIGALVPLIIYFIAVELWDQRTAIIAAAITAVYPHLLTRPGNVSEDNLYIPLIYLSIYLMLKFTRTSSVRYLVSSAVLIGFSLLTRQTIILFLPILVFYQFYFVKTHRIRNFILFTVTGIACILPWILFHYATYRTFSLSDSTGRSLWTGNNQFTYDTALYPYDSIDKIERELWKTIPPDILEELKQKNTVQQDSYFMRRGLDYIENNPKDFVTSLFVKNLGLFGITYNPQSSNATDKNSGTRKWIHIITYVPMLIMGFYGIILNRDNISRSSILILLILSFVLISWVFWSHTRHAIPYHIVWILFSADAISRLSKHVFSGNRFQLN